jgi:hypothetical protein
MFYSGPIIAYQHQLNYSQTPPYSHDANDTISERETLDILFMEHTRKHCTFPRHKSHPNSLSSATMNDWGPVPQLYYLGKDSAHNKSQSFDIPQVC